MARKRLVELLQKVEKLIIESEKVAKKTRMDANFLNENAAASPSASGDREHSKNQAQMNEKRHQELLALKNEIAKSIDKEAEKVEPLCFVSVEFNDERKNSFYISKASVYIAGVNLISSHSPIGEALIGKYADDEFEYEVEGQEIGGKIGKVE